MFVPPKMRSSIAIVAVLAAAGALAVATAGAPFLDQLEDSEITLEKASGPNGVYAVEQNGELAIRITEARQELAADGVNPGAVTIIEDIFRITYGGNESAKVWIETGVEDVEFRTEAGSIEGQANNVTLGAGESILIGLQIDTTGDHDVETIEEFTVSANVTDGTSATTGSNTGGTNAAIGGGDDTGGNPGDTPSGDEPGDSGESGDTSDGLEGGDGEDGGETTPDDGSGNEDDKQDGGETGSDDEGGNNQQDGPDQPGDEGEGDDGQPDDQTGEPDDDGPDTEPGSDDAESSTDGSDDGATAENGDAPSDLSQSGQPAVFEPAQTLGGFLPQLLGLMLAIGAGAGLFAAARAIARREEN